MSLPQLPRWTVYPALATLFGFLVLAVPRGSFEESSGAALVLRGDLPVEAPAADPELRPALEELDTLEVESYLPYDFVTDGSRDYRSELQGALDDAEGRTLILPDFPLRVGAAPRQKWCLALRSGTTLRGSGSGSELYTDTPAVQLLRGEKVEDIVLEEFTVRGVGGVGERLAHGLVQITYGENVTIRNMTIVDADADGVAIAGVERALVENNTLRGISKSGVYLSHCSESRVRGNTIENFGGQRLSGNKPVGAGIQLSGNTQLVCEQNTITDGIGIGILCNALIGGSHPLDNVLRENVVRDVNNPNNVNISSGIRCANGSDDRLTRTRLIDNRIDSCGIYGIYVENHGESVLIGNLVSSSSRAGIVVSTIDQLVIERNVVLDSDTSGKGGQAGIHLINGASHVTVEDNLVRGLPALETGIEGPALIDQATGTGNVLDPTIRRGSSAPRVGRHRAGDVIYNEAPRKGDHVGWVCTSAGIPGLWQAFGKIE